MSAPPPVPVPPASVLDRLVAAGLWTAGLSWLAAGTLPLMALYRLLGPDRVEPLTRAYIRGQVALTGCRWRAEVHPDVDPDQPYVFAVNHVNVLDHVTMYRATPHFKQGVELASHFSIPVYGWFMKARGTLPVVPGDRRALARLARHAQDEIDRGHSLLLFPEGTRTRTGRVGPFHHGLFHIVRRLGVPVVPVAVTGMWETLPTPGWVMRPGHEVTVHVLAPHPTESLGRRDVPALAEAVRAEIATVVDAWYDRDRHEETP